MLFDMLLSNKKAWFERREKQHSQQYLGGILIKGATKEL